MTTPGLGIIVRQGTLTAESLGREKFKVIYADRDAHKAAWLKDRQTAITGTDLAAISGLSKYKSPMEIWLEKRGELEGEEFTPEQEERMGWGNRLERAILQAFADREGVELDLADSFTLIRHPDRPLFGATFDGFRKDDMSPVDAKNIGFQSPEYGDDGTSIIPVHYAFQLIMQMAVTNAPRAHLAVLFGGCRLHRYPVYRNIELEKDVLDQAEEWWNRHIIGDTPPVVEESKAYSEYLRKRIKQMTKAVVRASPELDAKAIQLHETRQELEHLEAQKLGLDNHIKAAIGEGSEVVGNGWRATWNTTDPKKKQLQIDPFLAELNQEFGAEKVSKILAAHMKLPAGIRQLRFTYGK